MSNDAVERGELLKVIGVPKHSEFEPDYWLVETNGNA